MCRLLENEEMIVSLVDFRTVRNLNKNPVGVYPDIVCPNTMQVKCYVISRNQREYK